jgi:hypothetical protein
MLKTVAATLALLIFALPVRAQPNAVEAILIKQFLICDGALAAGCESFGLSKFSDALVVFAGAAEGGDKSAQNNLGMLYETGAGVKRSEADAKRLYTIAADAGIPLAQYNLAMLTVTKHVIGDVTDPVERDRDMSIAYMWLTFASEKGLTLAVESRQELIEFMTPGALKSGKEQVQAKRGK